MPLKVKNLTPRPVIFRLNSGGTLHLPPSATSSDIQDVEVKNNAKVQKLVQRNVISLLGKM